MKNTFTEQHNKKFYTENPLLSVRQSKLVRKRDKKKKEKKNGFGHTREHTDPDEPEPGAHGRDLRPPCQIIQR